MGGELYSRRKEIKYIVPLAKALAVREQLDRLLQRDEHCADGPYLVRSLYFDSVNQNVKRCVFGFMAGMRLSVN